MGFDPEELKQAGLVFKENRKKLFLFSPGFLYENDAAAAGKSSRLKLTPQ